MNLRIILAGTILALAMAIAVTTIPVGAQAKQSSQSGTLSVCNTASPNGKGGNMSVDTADQQGYVHNGTGLRVKQGGNLNAASHSRALALCSTPSVPVPEVPEVPTGNNGNGNGSGPSGNNG